MSKYFTVSDVQFQDNYFQFGEATITEASYFTVKHNVDRSYDSNDDIHYMIRYEMNKDKIEVERVIYGALDWLGDIGGFNEAMVWFAYSIIYLFQF